MNYRAEIVQSAERQIRKLSNQLQGRIIPKILSLEKNPRPYGSKKLRDTSYYRLRAGDYRIVYAIDDRKQLVKILDIAHRREIYR